mgnify:CR=1 FL=1
MNVLHINYSDIIGGRFNGYYMLGRPNDTLNSNMAVWRKKSKRKEVYLLPPHNKVLKFIIEKCIRLGAKLGLDHLISIFGFLLLSKQKYFKAADIIHLHIIHGDTNLSVLSLPKLCKNKTVVWTFHDQWAVTGGCIHPFECQGVNQGCPSYCPHPRYKSLFKHKFPYYLWKIKKYCYARSDFNIIVSTDWMKQKIRNSPLINNKQITIIPFGLDVNFFQKKDKKSCRNKLGIPLDDFVIVFRDSGIEHDIFKGLKYVKEALQNINIDRSISLIIIEEGNGFENLSNKYNIIKTGWINSEELVNVFSAADVFLMPSLQESFGLMAIEAMACSLPVIAAEGTALPEVIGDNIGGLIVRKKDSNAIVQAILTLMNNLELTNQLGLSARKRVEELYTIEKCITTHKNLYLKINNI